MNKFALSFYGESMKAKQDEIGDLNQEYDEYCSKYLKPINEEDEIKVTLDKAKYNITVAAEIAKQLIRAQFDQISEKGKII